MPDFPPLHPSCALSQIVARLRSFSPEPIGSPVCIEVEDRAYEASLETHQAALRQSGRYLRQFIGEEGPSEFAKASQILHA